MIRATVLMLILTATPVLAEGVPAGAAPLNDIRARAGLPALAVSPQLMAAADAHVTDMARYGYFSHKGRDGSKAKNRAARQGYRACTTAEAIAQGQTSVGQVMQEWYNSPSHRKLMLHRQVREFGLARAGNTWVLVLARPC